MPPVIAAAGLFLQGVGIAVASAVGGLAAGASLGIGAAVALGGAVVAGAALVASKAVNSLFAVDMPQVDSDASRQRTVKSTTEPFKTIYGETLVSGPITYIGMAGTDNADLYHVIALAGHEVTDIKDVYFDNKLITDAQINSGNADGGNVIAGDFGPKGGSTICVINKHLGTATQAADSMMVSTFSDYTSAHQGKNVAYIAMKWTLNEDSAETWEKYAPADIKAIVQGRKVYDPRLDVAAGNAAGANPTDATYIAYSTNPALCLADYLINSEFGLGVAAAKVDWPAIVTAADGCDVSVAVPGGTENRFTCNGVLFGTDSHRTNINKILSSMNATLVYTNGKYILRAGIYEAPGQSLNEDDLIGAIGIKTSFERTDRFNTVKGVFVDPAQNHKSSEFPKVQLAAALSRDNALVLEKEMQFPMTNSSFGAQRLARKLINKTSQQKVITFPANLSALRIIAGDRVNVSIEELSWSNKIFQCVGWTFADDGGVNLTLREDDQDAYDDPASNEYSTITASGDITDAFRGVPAPSGLSAVSGEAKVFLNWQNPGRPGDFGTVEVYASTENDRSNSTALKKIGETDGTQFVHDSGNAFDPIVVTNVRYYWIRCKKNVGADADRTAVSDFSTGTTSGVSATVLATAVNWSNVANPTIGVDINSDTISINTGSATTTTGQAVATSGLEAGTTVTQGGLTMNQGGSIKGGQSAYNSGTGFFLGYDSGYKFSIGNSSTEALTFDGSNLSVTGNITANSGTFTGTVNANAGAFTGNVSTSSKFVAGSGATSATMDGADANYKFYAGAAALGDSPFKVDANGGVTASRIVITRPDDPSAVIFDSAQDGLVGVGLSNLSAESDNAVAQVADELTSNTDYARLILSTTQTLTIKVLFPLNYLPFAISSAEDFPDSITLKLQKATITSGTPGTFSDVNGGTKTFTRRVYNGSEASNDNYYSVNDSGTGWYIRDRDGIDAQFNLSMSDASVYVAGDIAVRVQVSYVAGSGSTSANPSASSKRTLYFNSATQYFTIDDSSIIRDQAPGSLLTGDVILSASSGARTISWRDSDTYDENWSIEGLTGYGESGSGVLYFKFNNGSTNPIAFVDNGNVLIGGDFYSGAGAVTTSTASFGGGYGSTGTSISADGNISTDGNVIVGGDLTVNGTTTTVNTDNLTVKDNNITLNYATGDSSSTANNAGITVQDAVNSTTDATLLWKTATDTFEFSHPIKAQSDLTLSSSGGDAGIYWKDSSASDATAWHLHADVTQATSNMYLNYAGGGTNFSFVNNGNFLAPGTIFADGAASNSLQWEAGYDYSQVGHLPLTGGTLTGAVTSTGLTVDGTGSAIELSQSTTGSATYYTMDNTVETGGKRWRFGYSGGSSDKGSFSFYNQTDSNLALLLASSGATFSGSVTADSLTVDTSTVSASPSARFRRNHGGQAYQQLSGLSFYWNTSNGGHDNTIVYGASANSSLKFTQATGSAFNDTLTINSSGNATFSGSVSSTGFRFGNTSVGTEDDSEYLLSTGGQLIIRANDSAADDSYTYLILDSGNASGYASAYAGVMTRTNGVERLRVGGDGTIKFFEDTGTTAKMVWSPTSESLTFGSNLAITSNEIDVSSGNLTLDVAGNIILDADGGFVAIKDGGTEIGNLGNSSSNFAITSAVQDKDIIFIGNDNGTIITALSLDFSEAGAATFNSTVTSTKLNVNNTTNTNKQFINSGSTGTGANYININSSGGAYYLGVENSVGTELGASAYDFVMQAPSANAINLMVGAGRARLTSTGIDVTGSVTADGLVNNGDVVFSKSSTGVPTLKMSGFAGANSPYGVINFYNEDGSQQGPNNAVQIKALAKNSDGSGGELAFYTSTGTSSEGADAVERLRIDSSGLIQIGNAGSSSSPTIQSLIDPNTGIFFGGADILGFSTGGSERMRIDAGGDVAIGDNTFAAGKLQVYDSAGNHVWLKGRASDGTSSVSFRNNADDTYNGRIQVADTGGMLFQVAGSTRATIDASGNLLVGQSSTALPGAGNTTEGISVSSQYDAIFVSRGAGVAQVLNRNSDGDIQQFRKDGTTVGSIGTEGGDLRIGNGDAGLQFIDGTQSVRPFNVTTNARIDAQVDLGMASTRWKNLYLSGGVYANNASGAFLWNASNATIAFGTNNIERARITSDGNLLVGKTNTTFSNYGIELRAGNGGARFIRSNAEPVLMNRTGSDGKILGLYKDGAEVGSLSAKSDDLVIHSQVTNHSGLSFSDGSILPTNNYGTTSTNTVDLGSSSRKFKNLYLQGVASTLGLTVLGGGAATGYIGEITNDSGAAGARDGLKVETLLSDSTTKILTATSNSVDRFVVTGTGNVGISVTPSAFVLPDGSSGALQLQSGGMVSAYAGVTHLSQNWYYNSGEKYIANGSASRLVMSGADYIWQSAGNNTSGAGAALTWSESMRLSGGTLLAGTTTVNGEGITLSGNNNYGYFSRSGDAALFVNRAGTDGDALGFRRGGAGVGSISVSGSATFYNTSSDQRLKDKIVDAPSASADIDAIQVRSFDWKADGSHQKYGMIAQELIEVAPEAVSATEDPDEMMGVDYSKLVPMLIKEIQQLRKRVKDLEEE